MSNTRTTKQAPMRAEDAGRQYVGIARAAAAR
jgi:hypothetical protein